MESEAFLFLHGIPGSGKSRLPYLMLHIMGPYGWTVAGENVAGYRDTHRQWLARLNGKRFVAVTEMPKGGGAWRTADLNSLITGEAMEANLMRQNSFQFHPTCKLLALGNHRPETSSENGIFRRMRLVNMNFQPDEIDLDLPHALEEEAPQILYRLLKHAASWYETKLAKIPAAMEDALSEYKDDQRDEILAFAIAALQMPDTGEYKGLGWPLTLIKKMFLEQGIKV